MEEILQEMVETYVSPGVTLGFEVRQNGFVLEKGELGARGKGDADKRLWHWGSCAKSVAGVVVAVLINRGILKGFDETISDLLPNDPIITDEYKGISLRQLLCHAGGVIEDLTEDELKKLVAEDENRNGIESRRAFVKQLMTKKLLHKVGSKFGPYSNAGYTLLSYVLETYEGRSWEDLVFQSVAKSLKLSSLCFNVPKGEGQLVGHNEEGEELTDFRDGYFQHCPLGLSSTLSDWLDYTNLFLESANGEKERKMLRLDFSEIKPLITPSTPKGLSKDDLVGFELPVGYSMGWRTRWSDEEGKGEDMRVYWHTGTNFAWQSIVVLAPQLSDLQIVLASNSGAMLTRLGMRLSLEQILALF